jgi:hypothetical protein
MSTIQNHAICKRQLLLHRISENSRTKWMEGYIWALADEYLHNNVTSSQKNYNLGILHQTQL